ncbi:glycosyltransferase [Halococcus qingdaonensis]|uniref:glycosyltransferase n=1 Tax=Halococcus qingdaonensis TaxID=224402 RepID=UPI002116160E|nr:glycosyltransferase [Halococcus qingdaonensis]
MPPHVAAFTDTYLPTVNGVTYTIRTWRERWQRRDGRMDVVYPGADGHDPTPDEHPVRSLPFPFYEDFRVGVPSVPDAVANADIVHAHTPFGLGLGGLRLAHDIDQPLVASYHTPTAEYAGYLAEGWLLDAVARVGNAYERWFLGRADHIVVPSETVRTALTRRGIGPVSVVSNGVDTDRFAPTDTADFRARHDLPDGPLVGYTGRHGFEKELADLVAAAEGMDATFVLAGDGPANKTLQEEADESDADIRFLGFLDREELPALYSALDVFGFPSPVETEGLVALEAMACGTPVVGVDSGALTETIEDGETGYHYERGDIDAFRDALGRALADDGLSATCRSRRESMSVEHSVDSLADVYDTVL